MYVNNRILIPPPPSHPPTQPPTPTTPQCHPPTFCVAFLFLFCSMAMVNVKLRWAGWATRYSEIRAPNTKRLL